MSALENEPEIVNHKLAYLAWKIAMDDLRCSSASVSFVIGSDDCHQSVLYKHIAMIHGIDVLQTRYLGTSRRLSCGEMHEKQKAL